MGFYTGLASGEVLGLLALLGEDVTGADAVTVGVIWGLITWPFWAVSIKRGWWERKEVSEAATQPERPRKSMWSRTSDSGLRLVIGLCTLGALASAYGLLVGNNGSGVSLVMIGISVAIVFSCWRELDHRKRTQAGR